MADKTNKIQVIIEGNESLANAIRRSINEIPTLAIESVEIYKNDSALYDEIIAHRLGLIPIKSKRKLDEVKEDGKSTGKNQIQLTLKAKGPITVNSGDLKGDIEMIYDSMQIVILDKDQEIELRAFIQLGKGVNHAKYSPGFGYDRHLTNLKVKNAEKANEAIKKLGDKILNVEGNVKIGDIYKCIEDEDYVEGLGKDIFEISDGEEIIFFIESWGQIPAKEIFGESVKALNKNLKEVIKAVK